MIDLITMFKLTYMLYMRFYCAYIWKNGIYFPFLLWDVLKLCTFIKNLKLWGTNQWLLHPDMLSWEVKCVDKLAENNSLSKIAVKWKKKFEIWNNCDGKSLYNNLAIGCVSGFRGWFMVLIFIFWLMQLLSCKPKYFVM